MRTLVLILVMLALALAAGLSFVLPAAAQPPTGSNVLLRATCDLPSVPPDRDTVVTCSFRVENGGTESLSQPQLEFLPSNAVSPPDRYYFFSEAVDGLPRETSGGSTIYDLGDIAPKELRTVVFRIIVRSSHDFAADVAVVAAPDQLEYARATLGSRVDSTALPPSAILVIHPHAPAGQAASVDVAVDNGRNEGALAAELEFAPGYRTVVSNEGWAPVETSGGNDYTHYVGPVEPPRAHSFSDVALTFAAPPACEAPAAAAVATLRFEHDTLILAALDDLPSSGCGAFPATGAGSAPDPRPPLPALLATVGALCVAMGLTQRLR